MLSFVATILRRLFINIYFDINKVLVMSTVECNTWGKEMEEMWKAKEDNNCELICFFPASPENNTILKFYRVLWFWTWDDTLNLNTRSWCAHTENPLMCLFCISGKCSVLNVLHDWTRESWYCTLAPAILPLMVHWPVPRTSRTNSVNGRMFTPKSPPRFFHATPALIQMSHFGEAHLDLQMQRSPLSSPGP